MAGGERKALERVACAGGDGVQRIYAVRAARKDACSASGESRITGSAWISPELAGRSVFSFFRGAMSGSQCVSYFTVGALSGDGRGWAWSLLRAAFVCLRGHDVDGFGRGPARCVSGARSHGAELFFVSGIFAERAARKGSRTKLCFSVGVQLISLGRWFSDALQAVPNHEPWANGSDP